MRNMLVASDLAAPPLPANQSSGEEEINPPWWLADEVLWNPIEVVVSVAGLVFWFALLLGRRNYMFAIELFAPVLLVCGAIVVWQAIALRRAGLPGVFRVMWMRLG
ncbi:hypothetical protein RXV86_19605 [Alisedimentitalea sp. MJ-SS2]|uniref:hypothetical protein n=1 Tax=Aliisedimentitalea sp. MJ-SS2 TaxID=3049795 RepID=UPI0029063CEB|nr:hypothetical protein [Alisedimentitalea sp. MJ-SS2]MDU8929602.1 hypothetical protein [Alisedimentitalea sp. MJ-SS2]